MPTNLIMWGLIFTALGALILLLKGIIIVLVACIGDEFAGKLGSLVCGIVATIIIIILSI